MAQIDIRRKHHLSNSEARKAVNKLAKSIAKEFDLDCGWEGNTMNFSRSGVDGHIALEKGEVHVFANLGFVMGMMKPMIESEINRHLDEQIV
ncbi:MAG TPA: polyhydroxyalkanoic acid system family protein [Dokdonella sp.]|uniref:polyhydroxyalkanoic acid system family protein n=1 Tax=Dokdonella sp. TaxID=2291710 RepID=UPI002D7E9B79|nr:polyhydroxyalkanoic acid system family protein [Dokdonella sp.]HET9033561.1 polyhydroxyalkanoic acid system family protein [Dokdonella sp.]